jgi:HAD-superfamily hydrolase, subfamily IIB
MGQEKGRSVQDCPVERKIMRIAVSDYDGTMFHGGQLLGDVIGGIERWRQGGDKFGIATGRDYSMIITEIRQRNIPVDFVICLNGAAIYDADGNLLSMRFIPDSEIPVILKHPAALASLHFQLSGTGPLRVVLGPDSWFPKLGVEYTQVTYDDALSMTKLGQISLAFRNETDCIGWEAALRKELGDIIDPHRNKTTIDINVIGVDKSSGISELLRLNGWPDACVRTIGDGGNDLGMITAYSGYTVPGAQADVTRAARRVCADLADMLDNG